MTKAVSLVALLLLAALTTAAPAQDYPSRLIKLMQGFPPGGNVEFVARLLANEMSKSLGQTIIVESKPGQAGSLAAEALSAAEPDGYTLLLVAGAHPATAAVYKKLKYDPVDGFAWISTASFYPFIIVVRKESKLQSFADLLSTARGNPGRISSGTAGNGSIAHMTTELIGQMAGRLASAFAVFSSPMTRTTRQVAQNMRMSATPRPATIRHTKRRIGVIRRFERVSLR